MEQHSAPRQPRPGIRGEQVGGLQGKHGSGIGDGGGEEARVVCDLYQLLHHSCARTDQEETLQVAQDREAAQGHDLGDEPQAVRLCV